MQNEKNVTSRAHPSLLPLRLALIAAESDSPARPPRIDVNEGRALQLIARMRAGYKKTNQFLNRQEVEGQYTFHNRTQEMAGNHA
ncbi:MAG TPA: hypothetical protein DCX53_02030 [Anaerolineae bacterium]|nr:hypothetical protein [Anaerolineae bacterium]